MQITNATLAGGLNNTGSLTASSFVSPTQSEADILPGTGLARVIVFGDAAMADEINNSGIIIASSSEAADAVFFDRDNILTPRSVQATAIEIGSNAVVNSLQNSGGISALLVGRTGEAIAVLDRSGNLNQIDNTGFINAAGTNSDTQGEEATDFSLIAIDVSANTNGFILNQTLSLIHI